MNRNISSHCIVVSMTIFIQDYFSYFSGTFPCPHCDNVYDRKDKVLRHIGGVHEGKNNKRNHKCNFCEKKFNSPGIRLKHEDNIHRNIRKLKCDKCDASFNYGTQLRLHKESIHDGIMYDCNQPGCAKSYNLKRNLDAHKWTSHKIPLPAMAKKKEIEILS